MNKGLIAELQHEAGSTRKMLQAMPDADYTWQPHEKSMKIGRLATHIAQIPHWTTLILSAKEYDITNGFLGNIAGSKQELLDTFEKYILEAKTSLETVNDEILFEKWALLKGNHVAYELPKIVAIRNMVFNHIIHHRGQLSVFLRLLNLPVPGMYGPSYDEQGK